jgi:hypothetical protein
MIKEKLIFAYYLPWQILHKTRAAKTKKHNFWSFSCLMTGKAVYAKASYWRTSYGITFFYCIFNFDSFYRYFKKNVALEGITSQPSIIIWQICDKQRFMLF